MPMLRAEQIQSFTLKDAQIAVNAAISQSKIANLLQEPEGWISKGIVNVVQTTAELPVWNGDQAGRFYYDASTDELWMGTSTNPYKFLVTGPGFAGFSEGQDLKTLIQEGGQATDFANGVGRTFEFVGENFANDGSDSFVYLNGALQKPGNNDDFDYLNPSTIQFNFDLTSTDRVSIVFVTTAYMTNYATKAYVGSTSAVSGATRIGVNPIGNLNSITVQGALEELQQDIDMITGGSNLTYSMQDAYEDGSVVTLNTNDVDFRVPTNKSFKISDGTGSIATAAYQVVDVGGNKSVADNTGLNSATQYFFREHGVEYSITTGLNVTYGAIIMLMNDIVPNYKFEIREGNLVCVSKILGSVPSVQLADGLSSPRLLSTLTNFVEVRPYVAGTDSISASPILDVNNGASSTTITAYADILPANQNVDLGSSSNKFGSVWAKDAHFDTNTIYLGSSAALKVDNGSFKFTVDGGTTYAEIPKANIPDQPTVVQASADQLLSLATTGTGQVELSSETKVSISSPVIELTGNIIPTTTNLYDIGSDTHKIANVYAEEVHVGASSLYVNGKKVISDISDTMTFATEVDQSMNVKTQGVGNLVLMSQNEINAQAGGGLEWTVPSTLPSKNIEFTNQSANGQILLNTVDQIDMTASSVEIHAPITVDGSISASDLTLSGNLTVNGTTTSIDTTSLLIEDNVIIINKNQTGAPPTNLLSGIEIERGDSPNYQFLFRESDDSFVIGESTSLQSVATREDAPTANAIPFWNNTLKRFDSSGVIVSGSTLTATLSGNASSATALATARAINGVNFDGSANITITAASPNLLTRGTYLTGSNYDGSAATTWAVDATNLNTASKIVARDASGNFSAGTITANLTGNVTGAVTGNASTASAFNSARTLTINGAASTTINTTSSDGNYTLSIAGVKVNAAGTADAAPWSGITSKPTTMAGYAITDGVITSGNGLAAWTATNGNLTITLGTPSSCTSASTNATTATSHTHAITTVAPSSTTAGVMLANGTAAAGHFYGGTADPTNVTRLNYDGYFYATRVYNAVWNDLAEFMPKAEESEPGMVLIQTENGVAPASSRGDGAVIGVYSDTYGYVLGADNQEDKIPVGLSGRVNVWIEEPCKIGDLLITSDKKGFASVKRASEDGMGKVFAKVLENKNDNSPQRVSVLIMMA